MSHPREHPERLEIIAAVKAVWHEPLAWGVGLLVFFRPWRDGITYPAFNTYFLWLIVGMAALWAARQLLRGTPLRHGVPILLFGGYLLVAALTGLETVQVDATYRSLLFWSGHFFLFVLCTNAFSNPAARRLVFSSFMVSALCVSVWAILHFYYMLPFVREQLIADPNLLLAHFNTTQWTPELKHRLEVNRAYAPLLFPNALAAYLLLSVPSSLGLLGPVISELTRLRGVSKTKEAAVRRSDSVRRYISAAVGISFWFAAAAVAFFLYPFLLLVVRQDANWTAHPVLAVFFLGILPLAIGVASLVWTRLHGARAFAYALSAIVLILTASIGVLALVLTYSRGGIAAFVGALVVTAVLFRISRVMALRRGATVLASGLLGATVFVLSQASMAQQPQPGATPPPVRVTSAQPAPPAQPQLRVEGINLSAGDLANPASLKLRLTYWNVAWRAIRDNFWTGVGLGNFGTVYANYQYIGAGPTQAVHNDYLQSWAETGFFGFLLFGGFWAYFAVYGARIILRERDRGRSWYFAGLYCAIIAFLAHSLVDFNFFNPSLVSLAYFAAGLFYASAPQATTSGAAKSTRAQLAALPMLIVLALVMGAGFRLFIADYAVTEGSPAMRIYNIGNRIAIRARMRVAQALLKGGPSQAQKPMALPFESVIQFIGSMDDLARIGVIRVPIPGAQGAYRPLQPGELPPPGAELVVVDPVAAKPIAEKWAEHEIEFLRTIDSIYPYVPEISTTLFEWYDLLQEQTQDAEAKKRYVKGALEWAQKCVDRNPRQAWCHQWLAEALLLSGNEHQGDEAVQDFHRAIAEYAKARDLYPISPLTWNNLALARQKVGEAFAQTEELKAKAPALIEQGRKDRERAQQLEQERRRSGMDPFG